jgi:diguanylate cyclase (GGDEF)-like protein/PAS domain S-box-containing protein
VDDEIFALIKILHVTEQRLEQLTAGEVDTVANGDGRAFLLLRAQEQLRHSEAARQIAILNALPACIALLDVRGVIISVNNAWREISCVNVTQGPGHAVGVNYLHICDNADEEDASSVHQAGAGIRSVLSGSIKIFSLEYPCHSPTQHRWFQMTVSPLANGDSHGVVVMHLDVTAKRQANENLQASELRFRQMAENIQEAFTLFDVVDNRFLYVSPAYDEIWGHSRARLYADPSSWVETVHPDDRKTTYENYWNGVAAGRTAFEYRIVHPDSSTHWVESKSFPVRDDAGNVVRIASIAQDVTERKEAEEEIKLKSTILQTQQEVSLDAILVVSENGHIISYNQQFIELWRLSPQLVSARLDAPVFQSVVDQIKDSEKFSARVKYLYAHHDDKSREEIPLKDGRTIDRYSAPIAREDGVYYGRVWYFRDITERKQAEEAMRESEERFSGAFEYAPIGVALVSPEGRWLKVNRALCDLVGYSSTELLARTFQDITYPVDLEADLEYMRQMLAGEILSYQMEKRYVHARGHLVTTLLSVSLVRDSRDQPLYFISQIQDITERKKAEIKVVQLSRVHAMLSGINTLIVRVRDRDELFGNACRIAVEEGGFRMSMISIVDKSTMKIVPVATAGKDEELVAAVKSILSSSELAHNTMVAHAIRDKKAIVSNDSKNDPQVLFGNKYAESGIRSMAVLPLIVADEAIGALALYAAESEFFQADELKLVTELAGDIAFAIDHIGKQDRLDYLAYYDTLTGLANRTLFLERVTQYIHTAASAGHKLAVGMIDLERFKNINDSLGRPTGDALLMQVAEQLTHIVGESGLLARLSADHFAVVLPEVTQEGDMARLIEKSMDAFMEHPFHLNDAAFRIAIKAGIALFPEDGADADILFRNAEAALKKAKASGERYLFYTQKMTVSVAAKLTLENQLRQALDNEEFVLHYQPKINLVSGKLTSAEALIRWNDPRTGLVPPGHFIPILEETGLIYDVGRWALRKAISDYLRWRAAGLAAVRIAVNVSPLQLRNRGFVAEIGQLIGIDEDAAAGLELEITESLIMEDVKHSITSLQAIRNMGVLIAIDDFGTGFSSLSYLAKLPVDTLKIDRSFVIDMMIGPEGLALVSTIINLAHSLKLNVVAEGVETEEQSRQLLVLGCDEMQGYLFSKPVAGDIFETKYLVPHSERKPP